MQVTGVRWLTNLGLCAYVSSDDLNPAKTVDNFYLVDLMATVVFEPWRGLSHPAVELVYQGYVDRYNALHLVPEMIIPMTDRIDMKAGTLLNLSGHGEDFGARFQVSYRR